jgi:hypothetical protein
VLPESVGAASGVVRVVRPRPVAVEECHHAEHLEFDAGHAVPLRLRQRLVEKSADILVHAVP